MTQEKAVVVAADMATPYGWGVEACWEGLLSGRTALQPVRHFDTASFHAKKAGVIAVLAPEPDGSRVMAMLAPLLAKAREAIPSDAVCLLATTVGEIEYLEKAAAGEAVSAEESCPEKLLSKIERMTGSQKRGLVISAACSSSGAALAQGALMISSGKEECVLVAACDSVSEFVFSGFSSLLALDPERARPFDRDRGGLSAGEAAGYFLLMSEERALREGRAILGEIAGWGMSNDAHHMTGPSPDGEGLAQAITLALKKAGADKSVVSSISAHGTGTVYNDAMEMRAFKKVFGETSPVPAYSVKGAMGHTMAAAGLIEALLALVSLREQKIPPTIGVRHIDEDAEGWISGTARGVSGDYALSTNSGFGGVNAALLLKRGRS